MKTTVKREVIVLDEKVLQKCYTLGDQVIRIYRAGTIDVVTSQDKYFRISGLTFSSSD